MLSLLSSIVLLAHLSTAATPDNLSRTSTSGSLSGLRYTNVGASGSYEQVVAMPKGEFPTCTVNPSCVKQTKQVSGNLAPFNEELTLLLRGPLNVHNIAVYQPGAGGGDDNTTTSTTSSTPTPTSIASGVLGTSPVKRRRCQAQNQKTKRGEKWGKVSSFAANGMISNLVFMNNKGGKISGEWSVCQGASQSYANVDFTDAAGSPLTSSPGSIPAGQEVNIMTASVCSGSACDGFYRGTANHGWAGSKLFVLEFDMPASDASHPPAIWALNAQVVRQAQYGCNCRGMGSPGGCGEIDLLEVLPEGSPNQAVSELYSFKGTTGTGDGNWFERPTGGSAVYAIIFDVQTDQIAIQKLTGFDFSKGSIGGDLVEGYLNAPAKVVQFGSGGKKRSRHAYRAAHQGKRVGEF